MVGIVLNCLLLIFVEAPVLLLSKMADFPVTTTALRSTIFFSRINSKTLFGPNSKKTLS